MAQIAHFEKYRERKSAAPKGELDSIMEAGFTRTPNHIIDAIMKAPLSSREARVLRAFERATYGWGKQSAWLAASVLADMTDLTPQRCSEVVNALIRKNVLIREGGSRSPVRINDAVKQWDFSQQKSRVTPKQTNKTKWGKSPQNGVSQSPQNGVTNKDRKETTNSKELERTGEPVSDDAASDDKAAKLPTCPHNEIIDLWAEIMPDKAQPAKNLWAGTERARHLAARWKAGFSIKHEKTGEPLYTDRESGLDWWRRFFGFLRKSDFLMDDHRWFGLAWVVKKNNFVKIMELAYHEGGNQ